jgi:hypothetical protein
MSAHSIDHIIPQCLAGPGFCHEGKLKKSCKRCNVDRSKVASIYYNLKLFVRNGWHETKRQSFKKLISKGADLQNDWIYRELNKLGYAPSACFNFGEFDEYCKTG